jgi:tRNA U38,U39,U40 pseudouridine synthase TruA
MPHPLTVPPTVETMLFAALRKACLVESREGCGYTRCGRTDKGVSAAGQVLSIRLRSKAARWDAPDGHTLAERARHSSSALEDLGVVPKAEGEAAGRASLSLAGRPSEGLPSSWSRGDGLANTGSPFPPPSQEVDYAHSINKLLPPEIRVMGWADIPDSFSARFSATIRGYRYFFPRRELDVVAMREAAGRMVGGHDFRNVCKIDIGNTQNFVREVLSMRIVRHDPGADGGGAPLSCTSATSTAGPRFSPAWRADVAASDSAADASPAPTDVLYIEVVGRAFLWHQVRCMAALLLLVGRGMESAESVTDLLSPTRTPARPQYIMAEEAPLLLHHCGFGEEELQGGLPVEEGEEGEDVVDPRRPARFLRSWPAVLPALRSSPIALRLVTLDLERAWAGHATAAAALRATIGRLGATRIGAAELAAVLTSEAARAEGRLEGTTGKRSAKGRSVVQPLPAAANGTVSWAEAMAAHGQALISITDAEYPLHGGVPAYVPLAARCRGKGVEQRWSELGEGERVAITARHRVNAGALEAKVKARDAEPLGPTLPM